MPRLHAIKNRFSWMEHAERQAVSGVITQAYLELTTHCNLSCRTCARRSIEGFRPRHFSRAMMKRLLPMLKGLPSLERIVLLGFGEALCNPDFVPLLRALRQCRADLVLVSNAHFLDAKTAAFIARLPVDELWLSWDDDPEDSPRIRRGSDPGEFRKRLEGLRAAISDDGTGRPRVGMEIVAMRSNLSSLRSIIGFGAGAGIGRFIVSNIFPYSEAMKDEILYSAEGRGEDLIGLLKKEGKGLDIRVAATAGGAPRSCPFMERGTVFVTAAGEVAPCPELAHTHPAWYFGSRRLHRRFSAGNIRLGTLESIWALADFKGLRERFEYYEFPDCSACYEPEKCWHRTVDVRDCYRNDTPCGECLWAKGIILCP